MDKNKRLGGGIVDLNGNPIHQGLKKNLHTEAPMAYVDGNTFGKWKNFSAGSPYKSNGTIRRAIDIIAQNLAQLPFNVFNKGQKVDSNLYSGGVDIGSLLNSPNETTSAYKFKLVHWSYFMLYDKVYWLINRNPYGVIKEFYVLNPNMIKEHVDSNGVVKFYTYGKLKFSVDEVITFSGFNPSSFTGSGGASIIETIRMEFETDAAAADYGKKFFENGTRINGVITVDKDVPVTLEDMNKVLGQWMQAHQGSSNAYKVGALLNGMSYDERGMTMRDAEFIEGRKEIKERIIEVYGIPKSVFGLVDKIDRATADTQMRQFWQVTLKPLAIMMQEDINTLLTKKYYPGYEVKYDFTVVEELKKDLNETAKAARQYFELGYTQNEVNDRFKLGMDDNGTSGSVSYVPTLLTPVNDVLEMSQLEDPKSITVKSDGLAPKLEKLTHEIVDKVKDPFRVRFLRDQKGQEKVFHSKIKRYLFEYGKDVLGILNGGKASIELPTIINKLRELKNKQDIKIIKMTEPLYVESAKVASQGVLDLLGVDEVGVANNTVVRDATNRIKGINKTINDKIISEISIGVSQGETIEQMSRRVKDVYNFTSSRAKVIARTESANIMNASALATYKERGVKNKRWLSSNDSKVRDSHKANAAQGAIPIDQPFSSGEMYPNSVNCRCAISAAIKI